MIFGSETVLKSDLRENVEKVTPKNEKNVPQVPQLVQKGSQGSPKAPKMTSKIDEKLMKIQSGAGLGQSS